MKKKLYTLLIFSTLILETSAQITITQNDMPKIGDTIRRSNAILPPGTNYTTAGANVTWDFSSFLIPTFQTVDTFVAVSSTPLMYQLIFLPTVANLASPVSLFDFLPGAPLTDIYIFYRKTSTFYAQAGVAVTLSGLPIPMKYNNPDVFYRFPVTYLSQDSSESSYSITLPNTGHYSTYRKRVNHVDAWGTVITPYGIFPSIRVKSNLYTRDSVYIDSLSFGQALIRQIVEYKWLTNGKGLPIIQIDEEQGVATARYIDSVRLILGTPKPESDDYFTVFPNPATDVLHTTFRQRSPGMITIDLFDATGRLAGRLYERFHTPGLVSAELRLDAFRLRDGLYFLKINNGQYYKTQKVLISRQR